MFTEKKSDIVAFLVSTRMMIVLPVRAYCSSSGHGYSPRAVFGFRMVEALNGGGEGNIDPAAAVTAAFLLIIADERSPNFRRQVRKKARSRTEGLQMVQTSRFRSGKNFM